MENKNNKLLQALRNSGAEKIFEAYHWLREHRQELNKEVYGPVLLEVFFLNFGCPACNYKCSCLQYHNFIGIANPG